MKIIYLVTLISISSSIFSWSFFNNFFSANQTEESGQEKGQDKPLSEPEKTLTIMLDPAGNANYSGRIIDDYYERGITLACIQELKKILEDKNPNLKIVISRFTGIDSKELINNISFANQIKINFYFSLHFCFSNDELNKIWLYRMLYNPVTDYWFKKQENLSFYPYDIMHCNFLNETEQIGNLLLESLKKNESKLPIKCHGLIGLPFKPLLGLGCPAIACEISVQKKESWKDIIPALYISLQTVIDHLNSTSHV